MKIPTKKLKNGFELPVYGLGLWQMGGRYESDHSHDDREVTAIRAALDRGVTHIDTAELYGRGHAEELLAKAVEGIDRNKLIVATKVRPEHASCADVRRACEGSLERLKMDYIDLYMLHSHPGPEQPIAETMRAMDALIDDGLVRHIGVSNFGADSFDEAQAASKHKLVCNQVHYNLQVRDVEREGVLMQCQQEDVFLVAYRPLQKGALEFAPVVQEMAKKYDKTPVQIAINWLTSQDRVVTLSKTSHVEHLEENLGAIGWAMEPEDVERLRAEIPESQLLPGVNLLL